MVGGIFKRVKMTAHKRITRKASDTDIIRLNSVGMALSEIAKELDVHPTTVNLRLQALNIPPADTRRAFMGDIYRSLSPDQQDWLASQLGPHLSIKDFIRNMLVKEFVNAGHS
jgi:hypothetical protein